MSNAHLAGLTVRLMAAAAILVTVRQGVLAPMMKIAKEDMHGSKARQEPLSEALNESGPD